MRQRLSILWCALQEGLNIDTVNTLSSIKLQYRQSDQAQEEKGNSTWTSCDVPSPRIIIDIKELCLERLKRSLSSDPTLYNLRSHLELLAKSLTDIAGANKADMNTLFKLTDAYTKDVICSLDNSINEKY